MELTEDRAGATSEQQDNVINSVNSLDPYGPSWQLVPGNVAAGTVYAQVPTSGTGDLAFTRASTKTRTNASGTVVDVASGVAAIDYRNADGSLSSTGRLLLEPQRTNSIRNSTMVGAVAGSPGTVPNNWQIFNGGLTQTVVGIGIENGLQYIDLRFNGTAVGSSVEVRQETPTQIAASNGQIWSFTNYVKLISGSFVGLSLGMYERTSAGVVLTSGFQNITATSSLQSFSYVRTLNGGVTVGAVQTTILFGLTIGATYDFTIRIAAPQMELGPYATTFIRTSTAAVTRLADAASKTGISSLIGQTEGTLYANVKFNSLGNVDCWLTISSGTNENWIFIGKASNKIRAYVKGNGIVVFNNQVTDITSGQLMKIAIAYKTSDIALYINGSLIATSTNSLTFSAALSLLALDSSSGASENISETTEFQEILIFPTRLTNAQLAEITTL